jgi:tryptophan-rich sensory protein
MTRLGFLARSRNIHHMEETMAVILMGVLLFVVVFGSLFGADSRPGWRNVDRKPRFRMTGSMRPSDWERE